MKYKSIDFFVSELQVQRNVELFDADLNRMTPLNCNYDIQGMYIRVFICERG